MKEIRNKGYFCMVFKYANLFDLSIVFCVGTHFTCSVFELGVTEGPSLN